MRERQATSSFLEKGALLKLGLLQMKRICPFFEEQILFHLDLIHIEKGEGGGGKENAGVSKRYPFLLTNC